MLLFFLCRSFLLRCDHHTSLIVHGRIIDDEERKEGQRFILSSLCIIWHVVFALKQCSQARFHMQCREREREGGKEREEREREREIAPHFDLIGNSARVFISRDSCCGCNVFPAALLTLYICFSPSLSLSLSPPFSLSLSPSFSPSLYLSLPLSLSLSLSLLLHPL
jgi:hypothetical protein